jgi:glycosyltransferase involved in cell wall biosynthesis
MLLSVVIPAFNEERYLPLTLAGIRDAIPACPCPVEVLVVDNESTDRTAEIAQSSGARVVSESLRNIGRVRNTGAEAAGGDILIFVDADTAVPAHFLARVSEVMSDPACLGGSADIVHRPESGLLRAYLAAWRWLGIRLGMAQGAAQFCRKSAFTALNGYNESQFMGEDVDFYWRLRNLAKKTGGCLQRLDDVKVVPSPRRFDQAPVWRSLVWTNPLFIALFRKTRLAWKDWYVRVPR